MDDIRSVQTPNSPIMSDAPNTHMTGYTPGRGNAAITNLAPLPAATTFQIPDSILHTITSFISEHTPYGHATPWKTVSIHLPDIDPVGYCFVESFVARYPAFEAEYFAASRVCLVSRRGAESRAWGIPGMIRSHLNLQNFYRGPINSLMLRRCAAVDLNGSRILSDSSMYMIATTHPTLTVDVSNELTRRDVESRISAYLGGAGIVKFAFHLAMYGFNTEPEKPKLVAVGGNRCVFSTAPEELRGARVLLTCVRFTATGPVNLVADVEIWPRIPSEFLILPAVWGVGATIPLKAFHSLLVGSFGSPRQKQHSEFRGTQVQVPMFRDTARVRLRDGVDIHIPVAQRVREFSLGESSTQAIAREAIIPRGTNKNVEICLWLDRHPHDGWAFMVGVDDWDQTHGK